MKDFFGRLRQHGRANQNPTVAEALKSTQTLRVVDSVWVDDLTGSNCRGRKRKNKFLETEDCKPLPKRRKTAIYVDCCHIYVTGFGKTLRKGSARDSRNARF